MSEQPPNQPMTFDSFADWCLNFDSLSTEAKRTVEVLLHRSGTSDCHEAEQILSSRTNLRLSLNNISDFDLSPLQILTHLTTLYLGENQISNLSPLKTLSHLTTLHLNDNQISDLSPLQSLTNLTTLNLRNNQISDLSPLQTLANLTSLNLRNNQISDPSPLQTLTNLTSLNLHNNQITYQSSPLQLLRQEWLSITLSTNPIDRQKATEAIKYAYTVLGQEEPYIIFFPSPDAAMTWWSEAEDESLGASIREQLFPPKKSILEDCLDEELRSQPDREIEWGLVQWDFDPEYSPGGSPIVTPADLADVLSVTQSLVSQSGRVLEAEEQERLRCLNPLAEHCGWLFLFKKVCLVCDRPPPSPEKPIDLLQKSSLGYYGV
jgi:internalin A